MRHTGKFAPLIHNLVRLSQIANLNPDKKMEQDLAVLTKFNLVGRYVDDMGQADKETTEYGLRKPKS